MLFSEMIDRGQGGATAIVDSQGCATYGEFRAAVAGFAAHLHDRGLAKGDRVAVWGYNSANWLIAFFAIVRAGGVVPLVNYSMVEAGDYWEETRKPSGFATVGHGTFYIDYIGRLHETGCSDSLTDVRFLCKPPSGNALHLNVIDHGGQFRIDCLACVDVTALVDALEQAFASHGLTVERKPENRFTLPAAAWREGLEARQFQGASTPSHLPPSFFGGG